MMGHQKYSRYRSLRVKAIDSSEQLLEKLDRLLLVIIIPLSLVTVINAFIQVLF